MRTVCIIEIEELYLLTQNFFQPVLHFIDRIVFPQQNTNTLSGAAVNCCVLTSSLSSLTLLLLPLRCVAGCSTAGVGPLLCTLIYLPIPHARVVSQTDGHSRATTQWQNVFLSFCVQMRGAASPACLVLRAGCLKGSSTSFNHILWKIFILVSDVKLILKQICLRICKFY